MCNARTGDIYELETEVESAQDDVFAKTAKISEDEARKMAKDRFGGEIIELEYEIESDGSPTYEIDLLQPGQNNEFKNAGWSSAPRAGIAHVQRAVHRE